MLRKKIKMIIYIGICLILTTFILISTYFIYVSKTDYRFSQSKKGFSKNLSINLKDKEDNKDIILNAQIKSVVLDNPDANIDVEKSFNRTVASTNVVGRLGTPINVVKQYNIGRLESMEITFEYDNQKLKDITQEDLGILWHDEKNKNMKLMDSTIDKKNNTISFTTNHFGEYFVINKKEWFKSWCKKLPITRKAQDKNFDIAFAIDSSGSMNQNDPRGLRKIATKRFINSLFKKDRVSIVDYDTTVNIKTQLISNKAKAIKAVNQIDNKGNTNISDAIDACINVLNQKNKQKNEKIVVLLTDGKQDAVKNASKDKIPFNSEVIKKAKQKNIKICTISLGNNADNELLKKIASETNGYFYRINSTNIISLYEKIKSEIIGVNKNVDTDNDGLPDIIEKKGMRNQYGNILKTNPNKKDTDGDGISDKDEIGEMVMQEVTYDGQLKEFYYYKMNSNPLLKDTDGDTFVDGDDYTPLISEKYTSKLDNYIASHYKDDLTITIIIDQPITGTRKAIHKDIGHSFIRLEKWSMSVDGTLKKHPYYYGFYPEKLDFEQAIDSVDTKGIISRDDYLHSWDIAKVYKISNEQSKKILNTYVKKHNKTKYNISKYNCTTFIADILKDLQIQPLPITKHEWNIPTTIRIKLPLISKSPFLKIYNYSPADAGEDIKLNSNYLSYDNDDKEVKLHKE